LKRPLSLGLLGFLLLTAAAHGQPAPAPAESPQIPAAAPTAAERIVGVRMIGSSTVSGDTVLYYLGLKIGDPYDPAKIRRNFGTLWKSGLFENVEIEAEHGPGGVTLVVSVEDRPTIRAVQYTGNKKISMSQIREKLGFEKASIKVGSPLSMKDVAAVVKAVRDLYQEGGFRSATVDWRLEGAAKTEKVLVFVIDEGQKIKIASIHFTGNSAFSSMRLRLAMKKQKVATLWRVLSDKTVYNQASLDEDIESIKHLYQDHGYKNIVVKDPKLDIFVSNPRQKNAKKIKKKVRITIPLVEGEIFYFGKIDVTTDEGEPKVFPKEVLLKAFKDCREGHLLSRARLEEGLSAIEAMYKQKGYIYWFSDPRYEPPRTGRLVDIDVKMFEGDQFRLGRVEFRGNTTTQDKVLRRQLAIDEGQILDMDAFRKSILKISQLGFFRLNEDPSFVPDNQNKKVDVIIKGQEASRNELNFGAGYSGFDGFFGQFSFATRNFLGRGETISASVQFGRITNYFDLGYTVPWFRDRNQTIGGTIYSRQSRYLDIDDRRRGISVFYGRALGIFDSYSLGYSFEKIHSSYPVQPAPVPPGFPVPPFATSLVEGTASAITPSYRYDSTNDPFDPTTGKRLYAAFEYAGLGGTQHFIKPAVGATVYIPFLRHKYFGLHLEGGFIKALGSHEIPIYERFQLGGEQNIRGYSIGSIIPLQDNDRVYVDSEGRILGGNRYGVLNLEYIFAQAGPVKLLGFVDTGNTWFEGQKIDLGRLKTSVGLEMRVFLPIFQAPLRFIYAWNLHPIQPLDQFGFPISRLKERRGGFDFSIGSTF
jgi:outer membrane protein insertion porin family